MRDVIKHLSKTIGVAAAVSLPLIASGCALPPAVTVASLAADGISYVASGRTVSDHAISYAAQEDCALYRAIQGESICHPEGATEQGVALASVSAPLDIAEAPLKTESEAAAQLEPAAGEPATLSVEAAPRVERDEEVAALAPVTLVDKRWVYPGERGVEATFLALGSYRFRTNAVSVAERYVDHSPYIVTTFVDGERYYRVVAGPYSEAEIADAKVRLVEAGVPSPWRVRLCGVEGVGTNCKEAG